MTLVQNSGDGIEVDTGVSCLYIVLQAMYVKLSDPDSTYFERVQRSRL